LKGEIDDMSDASDPALFGVKVNLVLGKEAAFKNL